MDNKKKVAILSLAIIETIAAYPGISAGDLLISLELIFGPAWTVDIHIDMLEFLMSGDFVMWDTRNPYGIIALTDKSKTLLLQDMLGKSTPAIPPV